MLSLNCLIEFSVLFIEVCFNGSKFRYELLEILEFTSDRKRMSVVLKDVQSGKILLLSKGADEAILPRAYPGSCYNHEKHIMSLFIRSIESSS